MADERILIIDDSTELISLLETILPFGGYQAISATTGQDGLNLAAQRNPDLILLDLELPDTTGLEVLQALQKAKRSIPTIMMTGYGSEGVASNALQLGALGYLVKPFTTEEVLSSIERALTVRRLHREKAQIAARLETYARHLQMVLAIGRAMVTDHDLDRFFQRIVEAGQYATKAEACFLALRSSEPDHLYIRAAHGKVDLPDVSFPSYAGDERLRSVLQDGTNLRLNATPDSSILLQTGQAVKAVLLTPLRGADEIVGMLSVDRQSTTISFSKQDEQLLAILADYAVIALGRSRLVAAQPLQAQDHNTGTR